MSLVLTTAPATEPVTLAEAKLHLRIEDAITADDTLVSALIVAARQWVEQYLHRSLVTQTWRLKLDAFPDTDTIVLGRPSLLEVSSVTYVDADGDSQTMSTDDYSVDADHFPGRILLGFGKSWPSTRVQPNAVTVTFTSGYGNAAAVPDAIKAALKLVIGDLYANREGSIVGVSHTDNPAVMALLGPYRYVEAW